jgi:magnesium transporter
MIDIFYYENGVKKGKAKDLLKLKDKQLWIDITKITEEENQLLQTTFNLHPTTCDDLQHARTRIKVEDFGDYLFCVFYGVRKAKHVETFEMDFILGKKFLITNHVAPIESYETLKNDLGRLEKKFMKGNEFLLHKLLDYEIDNFFPVLSELEDEISDIEEEVTDNPRQELVKKILQMKRLVYSIKKIAMPQRETISFFAREEYAYVSKKAKPYFRDIYDHCVRIADEIDNAREAIGSTFEEYLSTVSNKMNEVMKVLTVIATIALPMTVLSSIYGTNFTVLPGAHHAEGFWIMIGAMALIIVVMIYVFKRRGWF